MPDRSPQPYMSVIGENLRRLRQERGLRQEDVAHLAQVVGLRWTQNTVVALETGRRDLKLGEWWLLLRALGVTPEDMLATDASPPVEVEGVLLDAEDLRALASRKTETARAAEVLRRQATLWADTDPSKDRTAKFYGLHRDLVPRMIVESLGAAEAKAAAKLDVDAFEVVCASHSLWECSLTARRDLGLEDLEPDRDVRAVRGHITRRLLGELSAEIERRRGRADERVKRRNSRKPGG